MNYEFNTSSLAERRIFLAHYQTITYSHNFFRIGGVAADLPHGWVDKCLDFCDYFLTGIAEYQKLITRNPIFLERVEGVGIIGEVAINAKTANWKARVMLLILQADDAKNVYREMLNKREWTIAARLLIE